MEKMKPLMLLMDRETIRTAASVVKKGGLIIYPTDTVYGLGCNPFNKDAVEKIYEAKGRTGKPIPILVSSLNKARKVAVFTAGTLKITKKFWPGPLTIVLKKKRIMPRFFGGSSERVGLRIPNHPLTLSLIKICGGYLVGTSANISGSQPPKTALEALEQLKNKVGLILDGGETRLGVSSTVLDFAAGKPKILREGAITEREILNTIETM
jgi:L-threonylcarbamoyladenylate synthase